MTFRDIYRKQVELLVRVLPYVAEEQCFALKGGTAINLFIHDLPRLSVDIDLTYLPIEHREKSLANIDLALKRIARRIKTTDGSMNITESAPRTQKAINKLVIRTRHRTQIKIEVTPVLRGCVYDPVIMNVTEQVEDQFGYAQIQVLSFPDLYAGKFLAALDRQHPRDLFDVHQLIINEEISEKLRTAFIVYLVSHDHSPVSLLAPTLKNIYHDFEHNFNGMTKESVELNTLLEAREFLVKDIVENMPLSHRQFLISFYQRSPQWRLLGVKDVENLPAVRWREKNLDKAGGDTCGEIVKTLEKILY